MSATTLNLPFKRYVAQVSTGAPRPKSTYLSLMAENLEALKACPWREATDVPVALADHDFTKATHLSDAYDAFKMTGNWNATDQTEVAYAGMAAYCFKIPASALVSGSEVAISSVSLPISRDRFLKGGVRIAWELTSRATPSDDWDTVRGGESPAASAYLANTADYLTATQPADGTKAVDLSGVDSGNPSAYLWIYVTLEDYTDWWDKYTASEARQYAIEGSAMLVAGSASFTFDGAVTPDAEGTVTLLSGGSSPTWLQPLPTVNVTAEPPEIPSGSPVVETFYAERNENVANEVTVTCPVWVISSYSRWKARYSVTFSGTAVVSVKLEGFPNGTYSGVDPASRAFEIEMTRSGSGFTGVSPEDDGGGYYLWASLSFSMSNASDSRRRKPSCTFIYGEAANQSGDRPALTSSRTDSYEYIAFLAHPYYVYLRLENGVLVDCDYSDSRDEAGRRHLSASVEDSATTGITWSLLVDTTSYNVTKSASLLTLRLGSTTQGATIGTFTSRFAADADFFDPAVAVRLPGTDANGAVEQYGLAATVADFSHAVATFEAGTLPSDAEILGRLARMSRKAAGAMAYLHPATCALADELDVLRPVPRFFRAASAPDDQTECQPGISAWYCRPSSGSVPTLAIAYRDGAAGSVVKVADPVFLQLAFLALRAPAAIGNKLVLTNGSSAQPNGFKIRFVVWVSPADQWDGSNSFAMAAMGSMPSVYRSDGDDSVSWQVDCSGLLMPLGTRAMTARRAGASEVVDGDIAANARIDIPLDGKVGKGDVVLIAPEVLGFKTGTVGSTASVHFGRQSTPSASANNGAWARYAQDLGWFPQVTGE